MNDDFYNLKVFLYNKSVKGSVLKARSTAICSTTRSAKNHILNFIWSP